MARGRGKRTGLRRLEEIEQKQKRQYEEAKVGRIGRQGQMIDERLDRKGHELAKARRA